MVTVSGAVDVVSRVCIGDDVVSKSVVVTADECAEAGIVGVTCVSVSVAVVADSVVVIGCIVVIVVVLSVVVVRFIRILPAQYSSVSFVACVVSTQPDTE